MNLNMNWSLRREADIDAFLASTREKFVGFAVRGDRRSMAGLPAPLTESLAVLERHLYVPLAEAQVARESELLKYPLSKVSSRTSAYAYA